jgi:S1-C subfamily serine protease
MAQLYLRDRAQREGWLGGERYGQELAAIPGNLSNLRGQMDDETFARYLYALGRPNQVRIQRVLSGSQAETAGLQDGDVLVRIDGQRIYTPDEVRRVSRDQDAGDMVSIEVLRDGRRIQAYIPRGPFGISMDSDSVRPDKTRSGS